MAENEALRQQLKEAHEHLESAQTMSPAEVTARHRWALGARCLGGVAMMAPFLFMASLCQHRALHHAEWSAAMTPIPTVAAPVHSGCPMSHPAVGFERFTRAIERSATVSEVTNRADVHQGSRCTVRIAPVQLPEFNCHVDVVCDGNRVLYGVTPNLGYAHCDVDGDHATSVFDAHYTSQDTDPAITGNLNRGEIVVEDRQGDTLNRVHLTFDPAR